MPKLSNQLSNVVDHTIIDCLSAALARSGRDAADQTAAVRSQSCAMTVDRADLRDGQGGLREMASAPSRFRLLDVEAVADILGMTTDWIYREVRAGRLPHIRLGRYVRFRRESIDAWLDAREHGGRARQGRSAG